MIRYGKIGLAGMIWITAATAWAADGNLRVGASRIDITPAVAELPAPYTKVHDHIYIRTILLDDGTTKAAVVVVDVPMIDGEMYADLATQIARQAGCPLANVMLAISHTHNSLRMDTDGRGKRIPFSLPFNAKVKEDIGQSILEAAGRMEPARAGFGRGKAYIAANRNEWSAKEGRYIVGVDRTGKEPFDPTLSVLRFENMKGEPIAFLINYGIEPVVASGWEISGDVPGAVSRYVEEHFDSNAVAAFTVSAAGDPAYSAGGGSLSPGRKPSSAFDILNAMGTLVGEEVLAVSNGIESSSEAAVISTGLKIVECPGKITTPLNLPNSCAYTADSKLPPCRDYRDQETDPVAIRVGMLRIGDFAFVHADVNVEPKLGMRVVEQSPLTDTTFVSTNFGPGWFIVEDATYPLNTYEATASRLRKGCGESSLLGAAAQLLK
jgi:neutral ceramidase